MTWREVQAASSPTSSCQPQSTGLTCLFLSLSSVFSALDSYPPYFKLWNTAGFLQNEFLAIFIERKMRTTLPSPTILDGSLVSTWHRKQGLAYFKLFHDVIVPGTDTHHLQWRWRSSRDKSCFTVRRWRKVGLRW